MICLAGMALPVGVVEIRLVCFGRPLLAADARRLAVVADDISSIWAGCCLQPAVAIDIQVAAVCVLICLDCQPPDVPAEPAQTSTSRLGSWFSVLTLVHVECLP